MKTVIKITKAKLAEKVANLESKINGYSFDAAHDEIQTKIYDALINKDIELYVKLHDEHEHACEMESARKEIEGYKQTLEAELVYLPKRFVLTRVATDRLVSPAGCDIDSRIYLKTFITANVSDKRHTPAGFNFVVDQDRIK